MEKETTMKLGHLTGLLLSILLLAAAVSWIPTAAYGFNGLTEEGKDCSACHKITTEEATELLKDIVKKVDNVGYAHVPGLFTVRVKGLDGRTGLLYIDFSKTYILSGVTMRIEDRQNVSTKEMFDLVRVDVSRIQDENSLILGNPGAKKKVYLFTDPKCPFCRKLHPELKKVIQMDKDIVFFIKMLPLVSIHPDAYRISKTILCNGDVKLLEDSFAGLDIPDPNCETDAIDHTIKVAKELGIGSTPTLVLPDGRLAPGYRTAENIIKLINGK